MAEEREVLKVGLPKPEDSKSVAGTNTAVVTNEDRKVRKARLARVLERGIVADRLLVDIPPDRHGEWVSDNPVSIARMQSLGFEVDTEYSTKRSLHSTGDKAGRVGDVIYMTCPRDVKETIDEIRQEQYEAKHKKGKQREEMETASRIRSTGLGTIVESREHVANKADIQRVLTGNEG